MDLHIDVFQMPSAKPNPVVIQLHGGEWVRGDRPSNDQAFRGLLAAGMSVVTAEFRNAKDAPAPAAIEDVRCAMAWVKKNAAKYNFDTNRVVMYGLSSGGQLALMGALAPAAMTPAACADQPHVAAVLDWYGPVDLVEALKQKGTSDFVHQWLGLEEKGSADGVAAHGRWPATADAAVLMKAKELSPATYIKAGGPPTFIVNGDADYVVDAAQSAELKKALDGAGVANGQYIVPGGGHGDFPRAEEDKAMLLCLKFLAANGVIP
jgi:acetyl esterase/lipase